MLLNPDVLIVDLKTEITPFHFDAVPHRLILFNEHFDTDFFSIINYRSRISREFL
jgi:hypothetical protein